MSGLWAHPRWHVVVPAAIGVEAVVAVVEVTVEAAVMAVVMTIVVAVEVTYIDY